MQLKLLIAPLTLLFGSSLLGATLGPHPVSLETNDGITIHGWYIHPGPHDVVDGEDPEFFADFPAVVLLHMYRGSKEDWAPLFGELFDRDIAALAIDMRGHGQSITGKAGEDLSKLVKKRDRALFNGMWKDATAAVDWLVAKGHRKERIAIVGASVGCSVAIDCVRRDQDLHVVATLSPGANYLEVNTIAHLQHWGDRSLLIISSEEEWSNGAKEIHELLEQKSKKDHGKQNATQSAELWLLKGTGREIHGTRMFGKIKGIEHRLIQWLETQLTTTANPIITPSVSPTLSPKAPPNISPKSKPKVAPKVNPKIVPKPKLPPKPKTAPDKPKSAPSKPKPTPDKP